MLPAIVPSPALRTYMRSCATVRLIGLVPPEPIFETSANPSLLAAKAEISLLPAFTA